MLTREELHALPEAVRRNAIAALLVTALADQEMAESELQLLMPLLTGLPKDDMVAAKTLGQAVKGPPDVFALGRACAEGLAPPLREKLVSTMLAIAWVDDLMRDEEKRTIGAFMQGIGLSGERANALADAAAEGDIFSAVAKGRAELVQKMLDGGKPITIRDGKQWTLLHVAVATGQLAIVDLLLARGADVTARHSQGSPPLLLACNKPYEAIVERLLRGGAAVDEVSAGGATALQIASMMGQLGVARALRKANASLVLADSSGRTPLHLAANEGHAAVVAFLASEGAPVDALDSSGETALHAAAFENHPEVVMALLAARARPDVATSNGVTPLHCAARSGFTTCARLLLDAHAPVDPRNVEGGTPLFLAAIRSRRDVYELLVARGANPDLATNEGRTPRNSIGAALPPRLRGVPLGGAPVPRPPIGADFAKRTASLGDFQIATWMNWEGKPQQVLVAGTDAKGRPEYAAPRTKADDAKDDRLRYLVVNDDSGRAWLPVFTSDASAAAFRKAHGVGWPENGFGVAAAVTGTVNLSIFRIQELPIDGVLLDPYGPTPSCPLTVEDCYAIARFLR